MAYVKPRKFKSNGHIESIVHSADLKNGQWLNLGVIDEEYGEEMVNVTLAEEGGEAEALLLTPHIDYGYVDYNIAEQVTKSGKAGRAMVCEKGNHFSFSADLVEAGIVAGDKVAVGANGLGVKKAIEGEVVVGTVIGTEYDLNLGELTIVRIK